MLAAVLMVGVTSCSKDDLEGGGYGDVGELSLTVVDGGYDSPDGVQSRATENGYKTTFTKDDKIGFYSIKNNAVVDANICLTYDGTSWNPPTNTRLQSTNDRYFVYYPYQATLSGTVVPTATTADAFFANVITAWTPVSDQSSQALYTASDLMVGKGTLGTTAGSNGLFPLTVTLAHKMGLAVITLPNAVTNIAFAGFTPLTKTAATSEVAGEYRYLVKPATEITLGGMFTHGGENRTYSFKATVAEGTYRTYNVAGKPIAQFLDFYYSDNTFSTAYDSNKKCIGIVIGVDGNGGGKIISIRGSWQYWCKSSRQTNTTNYDDGLANMAIIQASYSSFNDFPAFGWCNAMNAAGTNYRTATTGVWYLLAMGELAQLHNIMGSSSGSVLRERILTASGDELNYYEHLSSTGIAGTTRHYTSFFGSGWLREQDNGSGNWVRAYMKF